MEQQNSNLEKFINSQEGIEFTQLFFEYLEEQGYFLAKQEDVEKDIEVYSSDPEENGRIIKRIEKEIIRCNKSIYDLIFEFLSIDRSELYSEIFQIRKNSEKRNSILSKLGFESSKEERGSSKRKKGK